MLSKEQAGPRSSGPKAPPASDQPHKQKDIIMKKIFSYVLVALALPFLAACESDTDSNPVLQEPDSFVLNTPPYAENNVYDLQNSTKIELTCNQPAYGFPAATTYTVQVTLDEAFVEATDEAEANYVSLGTVYDRGTSLGVDARELAEAIVTLWDTFHEGVDFPSDPLSVTLRLKANLSGFDRGVCYSNAITLPAVKAYKPEALVAVPTTMYVVGSMPASGGDWSKFVPLAQVTGVEGKFYGVVYFQTGAEFKFNPDAGWYGQDRGFGQVEFAEGAALTAGLSSMDATNPAANVAVANAGWYTVVVTTKVVGKDVTYTVDMQPAEIYLIGNSTGGVWDFDEAWKFTVPADAAGEFVSPAATASGEARISVKVPGVLWWSSEFTLMDGNTIVHREQTNIIDSWTEKGDNYSLQLGSGQRVHLNFTDGTGSVQ